MLTESANNETTFLPASRILKEPIDQSLFGFAAALALAICYLHEALIHPFDCERFGLPESKALLLLGLESHITSIAVLVVDGLQGPVVESAYLPQCFGYS